LIVLMSLPNYITLLRVVLIPLFIGLMVYGHYKAALAVFVLAGITDSLDGMAARLLRSRTELGAFLDPMADKLLILSAFVALVLLDELPAWFVIVVVSRDVIIALGSLVLYLNGFEMKIRPSLLGKAATVLQLSVIVLALIVLAYDRWTDMATPLHWVTAIATAGSGIQYVMRGMRLAEEQGPGGEGRAGSG